MTKQRKEILKNTFKLLVFVGVIMGMVFASEFIFGTVAYAFMSFGVIFCGMFLWGWAMRSGLGQMGPQDGRNSK